MSFPNLLAEIAFYRTYSAVKPNGYKESWDDVVLRYQNCLIKRYSHLEQDIKDACEFVKLSKILPSMRMLQFAGTGIERENARAFNCSATNITSFRTIAENMYVLLCGAGNGFSVQQEHISHLPVISEGYAQTFVITDDKAGWCDSVIALLENPQVTFNYDLVRPSGARISTGGTASGPEPLRTAHEAVRAILQNATNRQLFDIEVADVECLFSDAVIVGGVRRSARICIFDNESKAMCEYKSGTWWQNHPYRARTNISAMLKRDEVTQDQFNEVLDACFNSMSGEPGVFWSNNKSMITNPCVEIALNNKQFCNLTTVNIASCKDSSDFYERALKATFLGTLQAGFTDFAYLSPEWKEITDAEALLGVSMTGICDNWPLIVSLAESGFMSKTVAAMRVTNARVAALIGIRPAARITCVKPEGTTSSVLGTSSGANATFSPYFIRTVRVDKANPVGAHLARVLSGTPFIEEDVTKSSMWVVSVPMKSPAVITEQNQKALDALERVKLLHTFWIRPGHVYGDNTHNVSCTINYRDHEKEEVKAWMWENRESYAGIALFPLYDSTYAQAPYQLSTEDKYNELIKCLPPIDLASVFYGLDAEDTRKEILACAGGSCEIT